MVARLIEGWEQSTTFTDYAGKWNSSGGTPVLTIGTASGRYGNGLRIISGSAPGFMRVFDAQPTWVVGFAFRFGTSFGSTLAICHFLDGATIHCGLGVTDTTNQPFAFRGTIATVLGSPGPALSPGVWNYLEVKATIHDTAGVFVVRVNGVPVINLSSQDTRNVATATANAIKFGHTTGTIPASSALDYDDLYVFDTTGSTNTDFIGDVRVERLAPSGAGATTAWTPSAGANYAAVDEVPPTADTDYVSSATAGQTDTYAHGNLVTTSGTVFAVQATAMARKDDAGSRSMALVARPGSTDRLGATQGLGDTYSNFSQVWDVNPDTSAAWTIADTNASEFGQRLIA